MIAFSYGNPPFENGEPKTTRVTSFSWHGIANARVAAASISSFPLYLVIVTSFGNGNKDNTKLKLYDYNLARIGLDLFRGSEMKHERE